MSESESPSVARAGGILCGLWRQLRGQRPGDQYCWCFCFLLGGLAGAGRKQQPRGKVARRVPPFECDPVFSCTSWGGWNEPMDSDHAFVVCGFQALRLKAP